MSLNYINPTGTESIRLVQGEGDEAGDIIQIIKNGCFSSGADF